VNSCTKAALWYWVPVISLIALVMSVVLMGAGKIERSSRECESRGGVYVKVYNGFECIKVAR
jgi:hypothetical protein